MHFRICLTKFRLSSHKLEIETGRYRNIERSERKCTYCSTNEIEDEYHFLLTCHFFATQRIKFIKKYYWQSPSMYKLIQLLNVTNINEILSLGKYISVCDKMR